MGEGTITYQILKNHLQHGKLEAGEEIQIKIDQTLTQDATGTLVMLELEELELDRVKTEVSVQYVDHNLLSVDNKNPDDHLFLSRAANRFGLWFSPPGNGISHVLHMSEFAVPDKTLIGSDSHTCAAGSLGMIAIGAGGLDVALAMYGEPYRLRVPQVVGVELKGKLRKGVSAKDVVLEMLRRFGVSGGRKKVFEYFGDGLMDLSAMDRHVIANMGAELGATTSVFPSDHITKEFMAQHHRQDDWIELKPSKSAQYHEKVEIILDEVEPLIAKPSSPGNVVPVSEVEGEPIYQAYIGSSANPGYRDFATVASIVKGKKAYNDVSLDINPSSREVLSNLMKSNAMLDIMRAGGKIHQAGCNGCIGMGQAPATEKNSLRTTPRNFPGRSGTKEDKVWLCSPETAAVSALKGRITSPLNTDISWEIPAEPDQWHCDRELFIAPLEERLAKEVVIERGPNIGLFPTIPPLNENLKVPVILKVGDDISTDEILPAGSKVLPFRSNIEKISEFVYNNLDFSYRTKARELGGAHALIAGENYGQGSSREHAVLAPKFLGLSFIIAKSYARIYKNNMVNFGVIPLLFEHKADYALIDEDSRIEFKECKKALRENNFKVIVNGSKEISVKHDLTPREVDIVIDGGIINHIKKR